MSGFATFLSKAAQSLFALNASQAALHGAHPHSWAAGGIYVGGLVVSRWKLTPRQCAKFCFIVATVSLRFLWSVHWMPRYTMAGMNVRYNQTMTTTRSPEAWATTLTMRATPGAGAWIPVRTRMRRRH